MSALPIGRNWSKQDHALDTCKTRASKQGSQNSQRGYYDTWTKQRQILERWRHFQTYNSKVILQFCFFFCYYFLFRIISNMKRNTERLFVALSFQVNSVLCTSCFDSAVFKLEGTNMYSPSMRAISSLARFPYVILHFACIF